MNSEIVFGGFVAPKKNYYHTPNEWIDICATIDNLSELKVIQYVIRHTWGFHEFSGTPKPITTDEFMHGRKRQNGTRLDHGTGLSNRSVIDGIRKAIDHNYLICVVDSTDKGRISKSYALNMAGPTVESDVKNLHTENTCEDSSHQTCNIFTSGVKDVHSCGEESSHRTEKDTLERHSRKTPKEKQVPSPASPDTAAVGVDAIAQRPSFSPLFADVLVPSTEWEALLNIFPNAPEAAQPSYSQELTTNDESALRADVATMPIGNIQSSSADTALPVPGAGGAGDLTSPPRQQEGIPAAPAPPREEKPPQQERMGTGKPRMPDGRTQWTAETFVQVCEARRGRRYPNGARLKKDRLRDRELAAAVELLKPEMAADLWTGDTTHNIQLLCQICDHLETRKKGWWKETNGPVQPHQLLDKDRVHTMYDEMVQIGKVQVIAGGGSDVGGGTAPHPGGNVAPPEQGLVGVSGRLRVVTTGPLVVIPPRRKERSPTKARTQQEVPASADSRESVGASMRRV